MFPFMGPLGGVLAVVRFIRRKKGVNINPTSGASRRLFLFISSLVLTGLVCLFLFKTTGNKRDSFLPGTRINI
jgi:hypothetical protein